MIRLGSAITASLKAVYTAEYVKTAILNILQNFGPEKPMSRKHFKRMAMILKLHGADAYLIRAFAYMCADENEHFDYDRFYEACGLVE